MVEKRENKEVEGLKIEVDKPGVRRGNPGLKMPSCAQHE